MGARGNSGVILSQIVRGFAEVLGDAEALDGQALARALRGAGDGAAAEELLRAAGHDRACDLMLVLGSSLVVNPAASLVGVAVEAGARVVLVNRGETPYDAAVSLRVPSGIGEVLPPAVERVRRSLGGGQPAPAAGR
jgi:hypothetical protein